MLCWVPGLSVELIIEDFILSYDRMKSYLVLTRVTALVEDKSCYAITSHREVIASMINSTDRPITQLCWVSGLSVELIIEDFILSYDRMKSGPRTSALGDVIQPRAVTLSLPIGK